MAKEKLNWVKIDTSSLPAKAAKSFKAWDAAETEAKARKKEFISDFVPLFRKAADVADDQDVIVSRMFGDLSAAVTEKDARRSTGTAKPKFKLS